MANEHHAAIRFTDVAFSYTGIPVLQAASFHIHAGEFAALVGRNGAGKTTVLKLILGLLKPDGGSVSVLGKTPEAARTAVGYVPQSATYDVAFPITVSDVVGMGRIQGISRRFDASDLHKIQRALERADVADLADRSYAALSGGQRRRVLVARALAAEPEILILDEPTANMDAESERRLFSSLADLKGNTTILIVTHDSGFVSALTDSVYCVGERGSGGSIVRHEVKPIDQADHSIYGVPSLQVLHDTNVPTDACCREEETTR